MSSTREGIKSQSEKLAEIIVEGMQERKAIEIKIFDLRNIKNAIVDFFVICSGNSDTQVEAIMDGVDKFVYENTDQSPWRTEGLQNKEWILLDYIDVIVHIFQKNKREYYGLEDLWGDADIQVIKEDY